MWVTARVTLVNRGSGQFDVVTTEAPCPTLGIALGRFRAGVILPDLVVADAGPPYLDRAHVYWNNVDGYWNYKEEYLLGGPYFPYGVATGRINPDTKIDFVLALCGAFEGEGHDPLDGAIAVFVGYGDGTFVETAYIFDVDPGNEPHPMFVKIGDLDQDGFNDVVTSNWYTHNISVLINAFEAMPPGGG